MASTVMPNNTIKDIVQQTKAYNPLTKVATGEVIYAKTFTDLITKINEEYTWRQGKPKEGSGFILFMENFTAVDQEKVKEGQIIYANEINLMIDEMNKIGPKGLICNCNCNYCTCNCNYCTCNCNWCTCNCNWGSCYHTSEYEKHRFLER